jgi:oligopeptide transport system permease protein
MVCLAVIVIVMIFAFIVPRFYPYSYSQQIKGANNLAPFEFSAGEQARIDAGEKLFPHIFGTDKLGRDYAIRVMMGSRISLLVGMIAAVIILIIGSIYGSIAAFAGGWVDLIMMRIVDIIYSLPDTLIIILLSVVLDASLGRLIRGTILDKLGTNMLSLFIVFGLLYWVGMARLVRGQILSIKKNEYVLAARSIGAKPSRIIKKHILPNCISVIFISTALQIPSAIFTESFLSFIGLGVQAPMPSLGSLANAAREGLQSYPYKLVFPAVMICLIVLAFNLLGDGLRDAFDPKLKR